MPDEFKAALGKLLQCNLTWEVPDPNSYQILTLNSYSDPTPSPDPSIRLRKAMLCLQSMIEMAVVT